MENNEIMVNEEVMETVEEVTSNAHGNGLVIAAVGAAVVGAGYLIGKKIVKPMIAKHKAKKELEKSQQEDAIITDDCDSYDA